jgi:Flp pilus assembly protein CpaB
MRRGRIFIYLAFIIILALVAFVVVWRQFLSPQVATSPQELVPTPVIPTVNVVVLTQSVSRGTALESAVLGLVPYQPELFIEGMFSDINEVDGRLAKFDLPSGIPLTSSMLVSSAEQLSDTGSTAALSIPRGMVAVSIPINRLSSVSYAPHSGDHVNVIVSLLLVDLDTDFQTKLPNTAGTVIAPGTVGEEGPNYLTAQVSGGGEGGTTVGKAELVPGLGQTVYSMPTESQRPRLVSQYLLQDVVVLKVGEFPYEGLPEPTPEPAEGDAQPVEEVQGQEQAPAVPPPPDLITLIVSPQDAITLNYLLYYQAYLGSQLTLALRSAEDDSRVATEAVTMQYLLEQYNIPVPAKLPYGIEPRQDKVVLPPFNNDLQPQSQQPNE